MNKEQKEQMIADYINTEEGRKLLWDKGFMPGIKEFIDKHFSKWDKARQQRWMKTALGV